MRGLTGGSGISNHPGIHEEDTFPAVASKAPEETKWGTVNTQALFTT